MSLAQTVYAPASAEQVPVKPFPTKAVAAILVTVFGGAALAVVKKKRGG